MSAPPAGPRRVRTVLIAALGCGLALLAAGCGAEEGNGSGEAKVTIYVSAPLSGPAGADGADIEDGARLALADADGQAGGLDVRAVYLDDTRGEQRFDQARTAANARQASEDSSAIAYIGELDSGATRVSLPITNQAGILQVSPGSGASDLVRSDLFSDDVPTDFQTSGERTFARLVPSDEQVAGAAAEVLAKAPGTGALIISDGSSFAAELISGFKEQSPDARVVPAAHGPSALDVEAQESPSSHCDLALRSVESLRRASGVGRPIARPRVFIATEPACAVKVLNALRTGGVGATIAGTDALIDPAARAALEEAGGGTVMSAAYTPDLLTGDGKVLAGRILVRFDHPADRYAAYGYEAMASVLAAIDRAGDPSDRGSVVDAYFDGTKRSESVIGPYSIDEIGETSQAWITELKLRPGSQVETNAVEAP